MKKFKNAEHQAQALDPALTGIMKEASRSLWETFGLFGCNEKTIFVFASAVLQNNQDVTNYSYGRSRQESMNAGISSLITLLQELQKTFGEAAEEAILIEAIKISKSKIK